MKRRKKNFEIRNSDFKLYLKKLSDQFEKLTWNKFSIRHKKSEPSDIKETRKNIKETFGEKAGIYCYVNKKNELLYIGQGKKLYDRIYSHYKTAFKKLSNDPSGEWHKFFKENL